MLRELLLPILLLEPLLASAEAPALHEDNGSPQQLSAHDLQRACAASSLTETGRQRRRFCSGFISGVEEGVRILQMQHRMDKSVCLPPQVSTRALTNAFIDYTTRHPGQVGQPAAQLVIDALSQAYPCERR
jgi:hypothetical protein